MGLLSGCTHVHVCYMYICRMGAVMITTMPTISFHLTPMHDSMSPVIGLFLLPLQPLDNQYTCNKAYTSICTHTCIL